MFKTKANCFAQLCAKQNQTTQHSVLNKKGESFHCFGETVVHANDSKDTWEIMRSVISLADSNAVQILIQPYKI